MSSTEKLTTQHTNAVSDDVRETVVSLRSVRKTYNGMVAVEGLSVDIEEGEIIALLGPSGCGKTTTLRSLAGLERIDSGEIWIHGRKVADANSSLAPHHRGIGFVFQSYALWPHMTVIRNVGYGLKVGGISASQREKRAREALDVVGLGGFENRYPAELSGGQQQRVALARSLVVRPSVLLLDEPLSNLDSALRIRMRNEIRSILKEVGITSVFVTHDQREAFSICDRVVLMNHGEVVQIGSPESLYETPANLTAASLLGEADVIPLADQPGSVRRDGTSVAHAVDGSEVVGVLSDAANDDPVKAMVRPEHLSIVEDAKGGPNRWAGRVVERTYEGTGIDLVIDSLGQRLGVRVGVDQDVAVGALVTLAVRPERVLFLN